VERIGGYYLCKLNGKWDIFTWCFGWYDDLDNSYDENDFEEIDERKLRI
jgi:hypothetical protein